MAQIVHLILKIGGKVIEGTGICKDAKGNTIECSSFDWGCSRPRAIDGGVPVANRQHFMVTVSKKVDRSSPLLIKALTENEVLDNAEFLFYRPNAAGREENFYKVELVNGYVASIRQSNQDVSMAGRDVPMMEEISFDFTEITWTYVDGGITHTDDGKGAKD